MRSKNAFDGEISSLSFYSVFLKATRTAVNSDGANWMGRFAALLSAFAHTFT